MSSRKKYKKIFSYTQRRIHEYTHIYTEKAHIRTITHKTFRQTHIDTLIHTHIHTNVMKRKIQGIIKVILHKIYSKSIAVFKLFLILLEISWIFGTLCYTQLYPCVYVWGGGAGRSGS